MREDREREKENKLKVEAKEKVTQKQQKEEEEGKRRETFKLTISSSSKVDVKTTVIPFTFILDQVFCTYMYIYWCIYYVAWEIFYIDKNNLIRYTYCLGTMTQMNLIRVQHSYAFVTHSTFSGTLNVYGCHPKNPAKPEKLDIEPADIMLKELTIVGTLLNPNCFPEAISMVQDLAKEK